MRSRGCCCGLVVFFLLLFSGVPARATDYFVATNGNNTYSGTSTGAPFATIQRAVSEASPGDTLFIRGGVYREEVCLSNRWSGTTNYIQIVGYSNEWPTIKGSDVITNWTLHSGAIWKLTNWADNSQQVFVDGAPLQQIGWPNNYMTNYTYIYQPVGLGYADMTNGAFFCDRAGSNLFIWLQDGSAPSAHQVEVSKRIFVLYAYLSTNQFYHLRDLQFMHCNTISITDAGWPGVALGDNAVMENCRVTWCDAYGLVVGDNSRVIHCDVSCNGIMGITMELPSTNWTVSGCTISSNNYRHFMENWGAAGIKNCGGWFADRNAWLGMSGTIESNDIGWNYGVGVWFDTCRSNGGTIVVRNNYVHDNRLSPGHFIGIGSFGIAMEVSKDALVYNNLIVGNYGSGIIVYGSDGIKCYNNTLVGQTGWDGASAVWICNPTRITKYDPLEYATMVSNEFVNNILYENTDPAHLWYQFMMDGEDTAVTHFVQGNVVDYNCIYLPPSDTVRLCGSGGVFYTMAEWTAGSGCDAHSMITNPGVVNAGAGDYRLRTNSPCVDTGLDLAGLVARDKNGVPRPLDGNNDGVATFDIGAFEFASPFSDTDQDGLSDASEVDDVKTDPTIADCDGDSQLDGEEFIAGTDPWNRAMFFGLDATSSLPSADGFVVAWQSVTGRLYTVSSCTNVPVPAWTNLPNAGSLAGTGARMSVTNSMTNAVLKYYRVGVKRE